jgi:hypothetical protein
MAESRARDCQILELKARRDLRVSVSVGVRVCDHVHKT